MPLEGGSPPEGSRELLSPKDTIKAQYAAEEEC